MKTVTPLEKLIATEASLENYRVCQVTHKPGTNIFETEIGKIHVMLHPGLEKQITQRTRAQIKNGLCHQTNVVETVKRALTAPDTQVRLLPLGAGNYKLYGLVNHRHFVSTDKKSVQQAFYKALASVGIDTRFPHWPESENSYAPREAFNLPNEKYTAAKITLHYGLDSGVDAYKLWLDDLKVIICDNGLFVEKNPHTWSHLQTNEPIEEWLQRTILEILAEHSKINGGIDKAMGIKAAESPEAVVRRTLPDLTTASSKSICAQVRQQYQLECQHWGETAWSVSQALSYVGTHKLQDDKISKRSLLRKALQKAAARVVLAVG